MSNSDNLKLRTARTLKWNVIDRVLSQVLYAVTGIVLARVLSQEDFGLVGATLIFQAFAALFVESGFSYALIQRKRPSQLDYSTVLWFNMGVATIIYIILWFCAPLIAWCFQNDPRIIPLSRVIFLSFILNASAIVQTNRLMKKMDVKMIAISNSIGLIFSGSLGIFLALSGYGAWAVVWQTVSLAAIKSGILWATSHWLPSLAFSWKALRSYFSVGSGMMVTSFLNTLFQNIYSFLIGNQVGLKSLGYYTQSDKWSKMGIMSISQVLTSTFLPVLSHVQDDPERFTRTTTKMNRFTGYLLFPAIGFLIVMATPIFHLLFGSKWDPSIILFQLLLIRGIFTVLSSLYNNYIISLGKTRLIVYIELIRDGVAILGLIATFPFMATSFPDDPVYGLKILLWGQVIASAISWIATMIISAPLTNRKVINYLIDITPYLAQTAVIMIPMYLASTVIDNTLLLLIAQSIIGLVCYLTINHLLRSQIQKDAIDYFMHRFRKKSTPQE